jgi:hypothetical protein
MDAVAEGFRKAAGTARPLICQATASPAPAEAVARRITGCEWLIDAGSQELAVADERTAIKT